MTVAVKSLPANHWGLYEMHGNVWEWCANRYDDDGPITSEASQAGVTVRALRGGSWGGRARSARSAHRRANLPGSAYQHIGFRFSLRS